MSITIRQGIKVGGSALPDGVMMLTPLAAAIARQTHEGDFVVDSFPLPVRRQHPLETLPFVRIVPKLVAQLSLVVRGWKPRQGRMPLPVISVALLLGALSTGGNAVLSRLPTVWHAIAVSLLQLALFCGVLAATRLVPRCSRIWRFHGGEHQAIATYEAGMDLTVENARTRTLYHPRCGTNLAVLALLLMVPGLIFGSLISGIVGNAITLLVPLPALCIAFEIVMWGQTRLRAVLWPGLAFQRLTVARPQLAESRAGILALQAALDTHMWIERERDPSPGVLVAAGQ